MGGLGNPKPQASRARRNQHSTFSVLSTPEPGAVEMPKLPYIAGLDWHSMTIRWWRDIWSSPMAPEYTDADVHGLYTLAMLVNEFWTVTSTDKRTRVAAEIRLQGVRFGLSPFDRRRLQWQIEETEDRQRKGRRAKAAERTHEEPPEPAKKGGRDPRSILRDVSA